MTENFESENGQKGKGILFVLSSPSGGGKTTLAHRLVDTMSDLEISVSHTTRMPRSGEEDGVDYCFASLDQFQSMIEKEEFLEWAQVHGNLYGTNREAIGSIIDARKDALLDIDIQGGKQVKERIPGAVLIFIMPPDEDVWMKRLKDRGTENSSELRMRLETSKQELALMPFYDYAVLNDDLEKAVEALRSIVVAERCRVTRRGQ